MCEAESLRMLDRLEQLMSRLGVSVRYVELHEADKEHRLRSGACRVGDARQLIVDCDLDAKGRMRVLVAEAARHDLSHLFLPPALRSLIEKQAGEDKMSGA